MSDIIYECGYLKLYETGSIDLIIDKLYKLLENCRLCPRECKVNRLDDKRGFCRSGKDLMISSYGPHFGEERPLVGSHGSGTIFLTNCNLRCVYCQNYEISHLGIGSDAAIDDMAEIMMELQDIGCHNINFVTPTHFLPQIVKSVKYAIKKGLNIPLVYNSGGYERLETIKLINGVFDIYMPDIKYGTNDMAKKYSDAPDYVERCTDAIQEMHRQVGDLKIINGIAYKGLLIRHLVLPNGIASSDNVLKFIKSLSPNTFINIMDQYRPAWDAPKYKELSRRITQDEFYDVINLAREYGLSRIYPIDQTSIDKDNQ